MRDDIENILFSQDMISERVRELGEQITRDYKGKVPVLIGVLKGSFMFMADLARSIDLACEVRFLSVSSYGAGMETSGVVNIEKSLDFEVSGRDIVLVEDILDSGVTLSALTEFFKGFTPASFKICTLLDKPARRRTDIAADYTGFICPDEFIVGYGLDYAEMYRNLPYIATLKPELYS